MIQLTRGADNCTRSGTCQLWVIPGTMLLWVMSGESAAVAVLPTASAMTTDATRATTIRAILILPPNFLIRVFGQKKGRANGGLLSLRGGRVRPETTLLTKG